MGTVKEAQEEARRRLEGRSETSALDGQVLLAHVLGRPRSWVLAHPEAEIGPAERRVLEAALTRLEAGEPLPYVLGRWEFFGLSLAVGPAALIPRPETELLVEQVLAWVRTRPPGRPLLAADVGTGSGCIAAALAVQAPRLRLVATDLSQPALRLARQNARALQVEERILFVQADLLPPLSQRLDLVCANLPYIPTGTLAGLPVARWEPRLALDGGPDGLGLVRRLLAAAPARLAPGGLILLEIEASQGLAAAALARAAFPRGGVSVIRDLAGRDRLVRVELER